MLQAFEAFLMDIEAQDVIAALESPCFLKSWTVDDTCAFISRELGVLDTTALRVHAVDGKTLISLVTEPAYKEIVGVLGLSKVQVVAEL